jgi:hypothetical protein
MEEAMSEPLTKTPSRYTGKWTCDKCSHTSDNEHDPCDCDEECCDHVETIASLRSALRASALSIALSASDADRISVLLDTLPGPTAEMLDTFADAKDNESPAILSSADVEALEWAKACVALDDEQTQLQLDALALLDRLIAKGKS